MCSTLPAAGLGDGITLNRESNYSLEAAVSQVIDELLLSHPMREIHATYAITEPVSFDRSRMGQLVSNLVGNALTHGAANAPVEVDARTKEGMFELSVANVGTAIPEAADG